MKDLASFTPKRALFTQQRQIGDVIVATATVEIFARQFPDAEIHFFTEDKCAPILENNPHIHKVWEINKKELSSLAKELVFYRTIAKNNFDLLVDFQQLPRCLWVVLFSGAPVRLANNARWYKKWLYTHNITPTPSYAGEFKSQILQPLSLSWSNDKPRIYLTKDEIHTAKKFFASHAALGKPVIAFDIAHKHTARCWPAQHYAKLIDLLGTAYPHLRFFLGYGPGERDIVLAAQSASKYPDRILVPPKVTGLRALAACISQSCMLVGNCSAPRHMAVALDIPSFAIMGASSDGWTFPSPEHISVSANLPCQACGKTQCSDGFPCLTEFTPEQVFQKLQKHFDEFAL